VRTFVAAIATAVVVSLAGGCSDGADPATKDESSSAVTPDEDVPKPDEDTPVEDSDACEEVRTGIAAFNRGDYAGTVEHFEAAVPLAEAQDDGSKTAAQLVEAVHYYAELDAGLYPEAARSSAEFAKYKAITLGQCMPVDRDDSESPGTDV